MKDSIYIAIIVVLLIFIAYPYIKSEDALKKNATIIDQSKGRSEILKLQLDSIESEYIGLKAERDSLIESISVIPKQRETTKVIYYEKKLTILSHNLDSSISFYTRYIEEADSLKW